jgi:NitT/TauT family transport system permease protein
MILSKKTKETLAPIGLLVAVIALWQAICVVFDISDFILPSPWSIWEALVEYAVPIAEHAWRTFWVTMVGFGIAIAVGGLGLAQVQRF